MIERFQGEPKIQEHQGFTEEQARLEIGKIITVTHVDMVSGFIEMNLVNGLPGQPDWASVLVHQDIPISDPPIQHPNGSEATYAVDGIRFTGTDGREHMAYVFGLPSNGKTSRPAHVHGMGTDGKGIYEHYFKINGSAVIGEGENQQPMEDYTVVLPGTEHPIEAGPEGFFGLILLENTGGIPDELIHIHPQKNQTEEKPVT